MSNVRGMRPWRHGGTEASGGWRGYTIGEVMRRLVSCRWHEKA